MLALATLTTVGLSPAVEIAPGVHMPRINLGTCCGSLPAVGIPSWFAAGGNGVDTAYDYNDQPKIGQLLAASGRKRSEYHRRKNSPANSQR